MSATLLIAPTSCLSVDAEHRQVYFGSGTSLWVYSIDSKTWTKQKINTGSSKNRFVDVKFFDGVDGLILGGAAGEREYHSFAANSSTTAFIIVDGQSVEVTTYSVRDIHDGANYVVDAVYRLPDIESAIPYESVTVEAIEVEYSASESQCYDQFRSDTGAANNSTLTMAISHDGGATYPKTNAVVIPVNAKVSALRIPVWQSARKLALKLTHSGGAGGGVFTLYGINVYWQARGAGRQNTNPTQVSSSL